MGIRLRPFRVEDESDARRAQEELAADGHTFLSVLEASVSWSDCLRTLENYRHGVELPEGRVPATILATTVDRVLVGRISICHDLNDFLANFGGHIGYCVRPACRQRGFASEMLRQGLVIARAQGIDRVLVTCDENNLPSARVIERNGGVLEDVRTDPNGQPTRRYWID